MERVCKKWKVYVRKGMSMKERGRGCKKGKG